MAARCVEFCDGVVALIAGAFEWQAPDAVKRVYVPVNQDDAGGVLTAVNKIEDVAGRQVYVWPASFAQKETVSRKRDQMVYRVGVAFVEVFDPSVAGLPPVAWCDERVQFVEDLYALLSDPRRKGPTQFAGELADAWSDEDAVEVVFDPTELRERRAFWSLMYFTYAVKV